MTGHILAIDAGTTSTRAILFDETSRPVKQIQKPLRMIHPRPGWVEQDPIVLFADTLEAAAGVIQDRSVVTLGLTNQRETTVLWDRVTGEPVYNAIVWQDRRTTDLCSSVIEAGHESIIQSKTGLVVDPYFSASKISWILDNIEGARARANRGDILFGTVDSYLIWNLTGGRAHLTDATNASRTMLFNIHTGTWDDELLEIWNIPSTILPEVVDSNGQFEVTDPDLFNASLPITGVAGDQQAATVGQAALAPGMVKCTFGTGSFLLLNTGETPFASENRLLTTIAYRLDNHPTYALEGSSYAAGSTIQWLRDGLGLIARAADSETLASEADDRADIYFVPAFTGLGAPHWDADARGAIIGLTSDVRREQIVRSALESVSFQTRDLINAMHADGVTEIDEVRVDGGMVTNNWLCQNLADILGIPVRRPETVETTALGAAFLASLGIGWYSSLDDVAAHWRLDREFEPLISSDERDERYAGWMRAVQRVLS